MGVWGVTTRRRGRNFNRIRLSSLPHAPAPPRPRSRPPPRNFTIKNGDAHRSSLPPRQTFPPPFFTKTALCWARNFASGSTASSGIFRRSPATDESDTHLRRLHLSSIDLSSKWPSLAGHGCPHPSLAGPWPQHPTPQGKDYSRTGMPSPTR